jgi:transposase
MKDKTRAQIASLTQTRDSARGAEEQGEQISNQRRGKPQQGIAGQREGTESGCGDAIWSAGESGVEDHRWSDSQPQYKSIAELEETIGKEGQKLEGYKSLTSIKGIGGLSGGILLSIIANIDNFADEGKLAAYFGIVARIFISNETKHSGRIAKRWTKLGRPTLIQCALIAQRYSPYLKTYFEKMKSRRGTGKAIVALARKFLRIIYRTLKNKWVFADLPNSVQAGGETRWRTSPPTPPLRSAWLRYGSGGSVLAPPKQSQCRGVEPWNRQPS